MSTSVDWQESTIQVVVNSEEQYSLWPLDRKLPLGWISSGFTGTKDECLKHIASVWKDMRPLSRREVGSLS
ncbi:MbtH family NRPS accessory protein [Granulicella mallensis]|jgi:MbtH protein|uniref:MbtH protein n=1 Tax=Granulicella mallensis TaxID=940614 RepID=A0A7W7ZMF1_9BACT|nr:MbtH family NRPS accessory protein [Granulicella mallensis]MBB5062620.1 MbtH protein [Granulicella mallensis]